jgi:acyl dehydratase
MRYLEDFTVGETFEAGPYVLTEAEIIAFAKEYDPQSFHIDAEAARRSVFGGLIASGWQTVCVCMRLLVEAYLNETPSLGSPGIDRIRWLKPVRPNDTLFVRSVVKGVKPSQSRPDRGVLEVEIEARNQKGETVMTMAGMHMLHRRPQS